MEIFGVKSSGGCCGCHGSQDFCGGGIDIETTETFYLTYDLARSACEEKAGKEGYTETENKDEFVRYSYYCPMMNGSDDLFDDDSKDDSCVTEYLEIITHKVIE